MLYLFKDYIKDIQQKSAMIKSNFYFLMASE